jgi:hypothetical protein
MTAQVRDGRQDAHDKSVDVVLDAFLFPEGHQLAFDLPGQRAG